jgi:hypothetical protein
LSEVATAKFIQVRRLHRAITICTYRQQVLHRRPTAIGFGLNVSAFEIQLIDVDYFTAQALHDAFPKANVFFPDGEAKSLRDAGFGFRLRLGGRRLDRGGNAIYAVCEDVLFDVICQLDGACESWARFFQIIKMALHRPFMIGREPASRALIRRFWHIAGVALLVLQCAFLNCLSFFNTSLKILRQPQNFIDEKNFSMVILSLV